jgi:hypothetical protein
VHYAFIAWLHAQAQNDADADAVSVGRRRPATRVPE